jgi:ATP-dependent RNA helicase DHX29
VRVATRMCLCLYQLLDRIILMSATMETTRLSHYFGGCPIISIPGRTFPVEVNYLEDIVEYTGFRSQV